MINVVSLISYANLDSLEMEHVDVSSASISILNIESAIFLKGKNNAAILEDATDSTIKPFDLKCITIIFQGYVF